MITSKPVENYPGYYNVYWQNQKTPFIFQVSGGKIYLRASSYRFAMRDQVFTNKDSLMNFLKEAIANLITRKFWEPT